MTGCIYNPTDFVGNCKSASEKVLITYTDHLHWALEMLKSWSTLRLFKFPTNEAIDTFNRASNIHEKF